MPVVTLRRLSRTERELPANARRAARVHDRRAPEGGVEQLDELRELLLTAGVATVGADVQHRDQPHPEHLLGPGKLDELKDELKRADANVVACDDELSPRQERNLEQALGVPVIDRTAVILDIFAAHAHTRRGQAAGRARTAPVQPRAHARPVDPPRAARWWAVGTRGPGETQIETDRRLARDRIAALKRKLAHVRSNRTVMRAERERAHFPQIALAGYTNAGKSTLLNALTGSEVGVRDRLFHTLDPTTRVMRAGGRDYLLTDTVGFIRKLPHQLVEAFGATLEETRLADLILHIVDGSAPEEDRLAMIQAVEEVLDEIGAGEVPRLLVLGKIDWSTRPAARSSATAIRAPCSVSVAHRRGAPRARRADRAGVRQAPAGSRAADPVQRGPRLAELHAIAGDLVREDTAEGVQVTARLPGPVAERFAQFALNGSAANGHQE